MTNELLDLLKGINAEMDKLDGRAVHRDVSTGGRVTVHRGGSDPDIDDLAEKVAHAIGKRMRREGLQ